MIVVGVDPGSRETGIAVLDVAGGRLDLLRSLTVKRNDAGELLDIPSGYLADVVASILDACKALTAVELVAVEGVRRPSWRVGGKAKPLDPSGIIATGVVLGAILGREYGVPLVVVPPGGNGARPLDHYPESMRPTRGSSRGKDALRHERSAYDVAARGPATLALCRTKRSISTHDAARR